MVAKSDAGRIGIFGRSGSGKSAYAKRMLKGRGRVVIFDPLEEYKARALVRHSRRDSLDQVRRAMAADWRGFQVAYVPPAGKEAAALSALCRLLLAAQDPYRRTGKGAGLTLVVEEMNLAFPVAGGADNCPGFAEVCSRGRHSGIEVIGISQRIAEVSTRFRGNLTETVIFSQRGPRDVAAAIQAAGASKAQVEGLGHLQYLHEKSGAISLGKLKF